VQETGNRKQAAKKQRQGNWKEGIRQQGSSNRELANTEKERV
jgi:hypothetical protein